MRILVFLFVLQVAFGQNARRFPAPGIAVPAEIRSKLEEKLASLQTEIGALENKPILEAQRRFLPDAQVYEKAVRYALEHNEFYRTNEFAIADKLLDEGLQRIRGIAGNATPWASRTGLVVRAYRSRIDGSVQPYGLVIPESYGTREPGDRMRFRLDIWLHGRDEKLTELKFIHERSTRAGEFAPADTFVLHTYGRYCNAFKFAGEVDVFEALEDVQRQYPIDAGRIALRGFSMGGAGVWHLATHYADRFVVAAPGAGFAESAKYMRLKPDARPWFERALWQWYDATDYALNLVHCPTVAYSGELDKQRQAADVMEAALAREGLPLIHLIGPKTGHKYEPETKRVLSSIVDTFAMAAKAEYPREIRFTTRTLCYPRMHWLTLLGLEKHWERADARAMLMGNRVRLTVTNVTSLCLDFRSDRAMKIAGVEINGQRINFGRQATNLVVLTRQGETWAPGTWPEPGTKSPGRQGPIDDAFMDSFVFVTPSGDGYDKETTGFIRKELERAVHEWRAQFRGEAQVIKDSELTEDHIRKFNLVLWGDPRSNKIIQSVLPKLPLTWTEDRLDLGTHSLDARKHVPLMIYPNPLNPERYVVLNSGFTFRGFGSNADQTPKLPDYAFLDVNEDDPFENISVAGFFDERWEIESVNKSNR